MKKLRLTMILFATGLAGTTAGDAQACGEVMYRMGGALRYHAFLTRHPASILVYVDQAKADFPEADRAKFHDGLEKAGHRVTLVTDADALKAALSAEQFDVIIAQSNDIDTVSSQVAKSAREPALIPVFRPGSGDERQLRERFPRLVNADASLNQFLKSIEQSMKSRGT